MKATRNRTKRGYPRAEPATLRDILALVDKDVPLEDIEKWTRDQRDEAQEWAAASHAHASDNIVHKHRLVMPEFIKPYPGINLDAVFEKYNK